MSRDPELQRRFDDVARARTEHRHELGRRMDAPRVVLTREAWLEALEGYVRALRERRLPIPPRVHQDLEMLRLLCRLGGRRGM